MEGGAPSREGMVSVWLIGVGGNEVGFKGVDHILRIHVGVVMVGKGREDKGAQGICSRPNLEFGISPRRVEDECCYCILRKHYQKLHITSRETQFQQV